MSSSLPKISIVTVVYNDKDNIEATINSCLGQQYDNIEYIIIDGGSTDGTIAIIEKYKKDIAYFNSEPDKGIYDAMNKGIASASGEWINFMNAGDGFYNNHVLIDIFLNQPKVDLVYGNNQCIYPYFNRINIPEPEQNIRYGMIFSHQSMFVKTKLMKANNFDTQYKISADYNFIYHLYQNGGTFKAIDLTISKVTAGGYSEVNILSTHLERKKIALGYTSGFSKFLLASKYNLSALKIILIKYTKLLLPQSLIRKITILKHT